MDFVSIIIGSKSDYETIKECTKVLEGFGIPYELIISSAHRTPQRTKEYVLDAQKRGAKLFIAAAGLAAHLAGAVASVTIRPVIGVPLKGGALDGLDALLSTVQMPSAMPVATVAIGKTGAKNAAYLAAQIMATYNEDIAKKLLEDRDKQIQKVQNDSKKIEVLIKD